MAMEVRETEAFKETVWEYYRQHGRHDLAWREAEPDGSVDAYKIWVSEMMLQQTQVSRVTAKYGEFLTAFPNLAVLAAAPLAQVLVAWNGLGYNRRAKFLLQAARMVIQEFGGVLPRQQSELQRLPGVGSNTAGAICAYAFNQPAVFIETNVRSVFIHHFFRDQLDVSDEAIKPVVAETLDSEVPREWYWALMDYGSYLKRVVGNPNAASKSYSKQSKFNGSKRQIRGQVIRILLEGRCNKPELKALITDTRLDDVLKDLMDEGLLQEAGQAYGLFS
jgi:A/G-specific adenine glycosylase